MTKKRYNQLVRIATVVMVTGVALVWVYAGWRVALGFFLMIYANNLNPTVRPK